MQKELVLHFPKGKISLHSISNHTLTIIQRLSQCLPSSESPGFLNHCPLPGSPKEIISHDASLPPESTGFLNCSSLPGSSRRWSVSSSIRWGRFYLGTGPGPSLILWPFLVSWSIPPMSLVGLSHPEHWNTILKENPYTIRWRAFSFVLGFLCSSPAKPPVQQLKGSAWLESHWGLQKCCRNQYSRNQAPHLESWRTQVYYADRPRGINTPIAETWTKGLQSFYRKTVVGNTSC